MKKHDIVELSHQLLSFLITKDDIVVDATMGNGYDTVFLCQHAKHVYAFDIQKIALEHTIKQLEAHQLSNATLYLESHENLVALVPQFKGVLFNLGYLPHGDHQLTTTKETTLKALQTIITFLPKDGFVMCVVYPGHERGLEESIALDHFLNTIDSSLYTIINVNLPYQKNNPPYIILIKKDKATQK